MMRRTLLLFVLLALPAQTATVQKVLDADTVRLDNQRIVRLYGITAKPLQLKATAFLEQWVAGKNLQVVPAPVAQDRYGRMLAKLVDDKGDSAQAALVRAGMARVYTLPDNARIADELLPLEAEARAAKRGLWGSALTVVLAANAQQAKDTFAIIEGVVVNVVSIKGTTYVNFGDDWKTDFTITMPAALGKKMGALGWQGKALRVRGWIQEKNGAMIAVTHRQQIELIP